MADNSKIAIQLGPMSLSAEGSEGFVRDAIALWDRLVASSPPTLTNVDALSAPPPSAAKASGGALATNASSQYENVFDEVDGRLKLIAHLPGNSKADKTRSVALTVLYGHFLRGEEQIPSETIRDACADQGCFDPGNFAQYLKSLKEKVAMNTKPGGGYDVKLTAPGRKAARELVEALNRETE